MTSTRKQIRHVLDLLGLRLLIEFNQRFGDDIERTLRWLARWPVRIGLTLLVTGVFVGGMLFSLFEPDASLIDGWYWATVVMPTVGFGDFSPVTIGGRWVYEWVTLFGRLGEILITGALVGAVAATRLDTHTDTPELDDDIDAIKQALIDRLDGLKAVTSDPRVKAALREAHNERNPQCSGS